jgi:hypothetical protein
MPSLASEKFLRHVMATRCDFAVVAPLLTLKCAALLKIPI